MYVLTSVRWVSSNHCDGDTAANNTGIVPDLMDFTFKFEEILCIIWFLKANAGTKGRWKQITRAGNVITPPTEESVVAKDTLAWRRYPREYLRSQWNPSLIPYQCHMISESQNKESHSTKCHQSLGVTWVLRTPGRETEKLRLCSQLPSVKGLQPINQLTFQSFISP